jgi:hypothetical protein
MRVFEVARLHGRDYVTPEDVREALATGTSKTDLWVEVLQAIEAKAAEDVSACAFAVLDGLGLKVRRRVKGGAYEER